MVEKLIRFSFNQKGQVLEPNIKDCIKSLKTLPSSQAISALSLYYKGIKRELAKTTLEIDSPVVLSSLEQKQVAKIVGTKYSINDIKVNLDSSLFGGLRIKIGDVVFDDTVRSKIGQLKGVIYG